MRMAIRLSEEAAATGEVPVGAVIVKDGRMLGRAYNQVEMLKDPTAHAEILAITQAAAAVEDWRLKGCTLFVTKEPCFMCAGALVLARIDRVVWGMTDPKRGGAISIFNTLQEPRLNHRVDWTAGFLEEECKAVMQNFFRERREHSDGKANASAQ